MSGEVYVDSISGVSASAAVAERGGCAAVLGGVGRAMRVQVGLQHRLNPSIKGDGYQIRLI